MCFVLYLVSRYIFSYSLLFPLMYCIWCIQSYYKYEILREGNSLSQIHSLHFCIFLKLVQSGSIPPCPSLSEKEIGIGSLFVAFCHRSFICRHLDPVCLEECDPTLTTPHPNSTNASLMSWLGHFPMVAIFWTTTIWLVGVFWAHFCPLCLISVSFGGLFRVVHYFSLLIPRILLSSRCITGLCPSLYLVSTCLQGVSPFFMGLLL